MRCVRRGAAGGPHRQRVQQRGLAAAAGPHHGQQAARQRIPLGKRGAERGRTAARVSRCRPASPRGAPRSAPTRRRGPTCGRGRGPRGSTRHSRAAQGRLMAHVPHRRLRWARPRRPCARGDEAGARARDAHAGGAHPATLAALRASSCAVVRPQLCTYRDARACPARRRSAAPRRDVAPRCAALPRCELRSCPAPRDSPRLRVRSGRRRGGAGVAAAGAAAARGGR